MSLLQEKSVEATIEVAYSDLRKYDMKIEHQKTCSLVINIIKHIFEKHNIKLNEISIPVNKNTDVDIYFEITLDSLRNINDIKKDIMEKTVGSLSSIEILIDV